MGKGQKIKVRILVYSNGDVDVDGTYFDRSDIHSILEMYPKKDFIIESVEPWCWKVSREIVKHVRQVLGFKKKT
jgi:hypothetical protein